MSSRAFWIFLAAAIGAGVAAMTTLPRGIRNNNPGNVRRSSDNWLGAAAQQSDAEYVQFIGPEYGLRAMGRILLNYSARHGLNTVAGIVSRYAPAHENPTNAYIANVSARLFPGVPPAVAAATRFDVAARLPELMRAMVIQEQGATAAALHVPSSVYDAALALLG
jgi:hypothetical protein